MHASKRGRAVVAAFIPALLACGAERSPKAAADSFYRAVHDRDEDAIRAACDSFGGAIPLDNFLLLIDGESPRFVVPAEAVPEIHENLAIAPTVLDDDTNPLRFRTFLVAQKGGWKVLMGATGADLKASLLRQVVTAGNEGIRDADRRLQQALESGNQRAADDIRRLRDRMRSGQDTLREQMLSVHSMLQFFLRSRFPGYELPPLEED
jgi:hypothetical protein